jgi:hypothetical protein
MRFVLVSTEDSSEIPVDIPDEIVTQPPKEIRKESISVSKRTPKKIRKTINKSKSTQRSKYGKIINKSKSTQRSRSIVSKHGPIHHRN